MGNKIGDGSISKNKIADGKEEEGISMIRWVAVICQNPTLFLTTRYSPFIFDD